MKRLISAALLLMVGYAIALAANTKQTVSQVTSAVSLTADVDYHITSAEPFTTTGSIDIVNTDHAVVIFDNLRPTEAKSFLGFITINGEAAKDNTNCQLKLYNRGAILLPYGGSSFRPLTVFDEANFGGESFNALFEGHNGKGYMKDIPDAWNNRIQSFKLKRGYMVTFALKKGGYGYSRCFIAADSDLEITLPSLMAGRISSYRVFKWYDTGKKQLANAAGDKTSLDLLNVQSTYDWGQGNTSLQPNYEWVANHIYEDWPSSSTIGSISQSPHTKTNNEPKNTKDDHPQDLETILNNWENMMRTGLRLCSPASWDGSDYWNATGFLADFLDEVDKRGWRCDIIDLHCYWPEGNFGNVSNWANKYKRPIWISEWCWGASWNNNGSFSGNATEASFANAIKNITTNLNNNAAVERYYYWNNEDAIWPCKLTRDGKLTLAGEYYSQMDTGLGYTGYGNYVPSTPPVPTSGITDLAVEYSPAKKGCVLTWTNLNGDLSTKLSIRRKKDNEKSYQVIAELKGSDYEDTDQMTYIDTVEPGAKYTYQIYDVYYTNKINKSNTVSITISSTKGTEDVQYGTMTTVPKTPTICDLATSFEDKPAAIFGSASYNNTQCGIINNLLSIDQGTTLRYEAINYQENLWDGTTATKSESSNFIVAKTGNGKIGDLNYEAGYVPKAKATTRSFKDAAYVKASVVEVSFLQPFNDVPVVMVTPIHATETLPALMWRVFDVTKEGFKLQLQYQNSETSTKPSHKVSYFAIDKGTGADGQGSLYTVGSAEKSFATDQVSLDYGTTLENPIMLTQLQSFNHQAGAILRIPSVGAESAYLRMQVDPSNTSMVLSNDVVATETVGYILISKDPDYTGIQDLTREAGIIRPADSRAYDLSGRALNPATLRKGIYIINGQKVLIK